MSLRLRLVFAFLVLAGGGASLLVRWLVDDLRPRYLESMEEGMVDTATLLSAVRRELATVSHQAVYDVLDALTRHGVVRRIQPAGSPARYELRVGDNHHHVACRSCGAVADVDCAVGSTPCLTASEDHGYVIDEAEVVFWGTCPACSTVCPDDDRSPHQEGSR